MRTPAFTYTGRVVGTPTVHHVTSMGNAAKQFVIVAAGMTDARVAVTAGNASIGYTIGNSTFRALEHRFLFDARGKVYGAERVEPDTRTEYARDLVAGDRIVLSSGRVVKLEDTRRIGLPDRIEIELAYATEDGAVEWHQGVAWDTSWTVIDA